MFRIQPDSSDRVPTIFRHMPATGARAHACGFDAGRGHVESLGGRWTGVRRDYDEGVVLTMLDPEGHEFCLVQYYGTSSARS